MCAVLQIGTDSQVVKSIDIATMSKEDATFKVKPLLQAGCYHEVLFLRSAVVGCGLCLQCCTCAVL